MKIKLERDVGRGQCDQLQRRTHFQGKSNLTSSNLTSAAEAVRRHDNPGFLPKGLELRRLIGTRFLFKFP